MKYSFSMVDRYRKCPLNWYFYYGLELRPPLELVADNPLIVGTFMHDTIELGFEKAEEKYYKNYPIINDGHIEESIKLNWLYPEYKKIIPNGELEYRLECDNFIGYIDLLATNDDGTFDIYDFKYTKSINYYKDSMQLHLYKYYFEKITGNEVRGLKYLHVPKVRLKKELPTLEYRQLLINELDKVKPQIIDVKYDSNKIAEFNQLKKDIENGKLYKNKGKLCWFCDYKKECEKVKL